MVHALNNARRVLVRGGLLVDIRPTPDRPVFYWQSPEGRLAVGHLSGRRKRFQVAQENLERAMQQGLFRLRHSEEFVLLHHAFSLRQLLAYVAREFPRSWVSDVTVRRIGGLLGPRAAGHLIIEEFARVAILDRA